MVGDTCYEIDLLNLKPNFLCIVVNNTVKSSNTYATHYNQN